METLRRKPVVRESEVFSALFPRGFTPKPGDALPSLVAPKSDHGEALDGEAVEQARHDRRIPKLGALSPKTPRALMATLPMTSSDCAVVWKFLCDWITAQVAMEVPATIPGFGTVSMRTQALKIRITFFEPDRGFLEKHGLRVDTSSVTAHGPLSRTRSSSNISSPPTAVVAQSSPGVDVHAFNFVEMAACCGRHVEMNKAKDWLSTLLLRLGEAMRQCDRVEINLGVGVVACVSRVIETHMLPRHTSTPSTVLFEVRTGESVVKRALKIPSSSIAVRPITYLSGSNFPTAIRLHAAKEREDSDKSDLFAFDGSSRLRHKPARGLTTVSPAFSSISTGQSPRTRRLQNQSVEHQVVPSKNASFAPLFDTISRTFCVERDLNLSFLQPSNRIASNYAPVAVRLLMAKHSRRSAGTGRGGPAGVVFTMESLPCDPPYPEEISIHVFSAMPSESESEEAAKRREVSEERYFAYLHDSNHLMDVRWLAPLAEVLVDRIVASAVKYLISSPSGHMKSVLDAAREEFVANYHVSVKKAIMDYLLLRSAARERLGILRGTPVHTALPLRWQWGNSRGINGCMNDLKTLATTFTPSVDKPLLHKRKWNRVGARSMGAGDSSLTIKKRRRKRVKTRLTSAFMLCDPQIRVLQYMWFDFESTLLLVKVPDPQELSERLEPLDLLAFEEVQLAHASHVRGYLMENWYHRAKQLFENAVVKSRADSFSSAESVQLKHLFNAVAAQMSLQVRSLIFKSIRAYAAFFELFAHPSYPSEPSPRLGPHDSERSKQSNCRSALLVSLVLLNGGVEYETPLVEIPSMVISVLHNLTQLFHNVNRIETQFAKSLEPIFTKSLGGVSDTETYSPFLWNVSVQEGEIVATTTRIREIVERNLAKLEKLRAEYSAYGVAYRQISVVHKDASLAGGGQISSSEKIGVWRQELQRIRNVASTFEKTARSTRHLNLFSVDCVGVNDSLLSAFLLWVHQQLSSFAEDTAGFNAQLRQQYKDVAARLAKRPFDLYELVDAEEFVEALKAKKLKELQEKVEDIKERVQFLLFHSETVHIGGFANHQEQIASNVTTFSVPSELLASSAKTIRWRTHIEKLLQEAESSLVGERARIEAVFLAKRNRFQAEIEEFDAEVKSFSKKGDLRHAATYVVQLAKMKEALLGFRRQMESITEEELKLQWKPTDLGKLDDIAEEMEPYEQLWKTVREFRELNSRWLRTNVFELQSHEGLQTLQVMMGIISTVSNQLHLNSAAAAITAELIKKQMGDFRENAKLVSAIVNPSVQERHLKEMSALIGFTIHPVEFVTLLKLLENGAFDHLARIVEISEDATLEKQVEDGLRSIDDEWQGVQIHFKSAEKDSSIQPNGGESERKEDNAVQPLMKSSVSEIKLLIEDHQLRLQTLKCLPHAVPFSLHIQQWLSFLQDLSEILDLMVTNERWWKRIRPLFAVRIVDDTTLEAVFAHADLLHRSTSASLKSRSVCLELVESAPSPSDSSIARIAMSDALNEGGMSHGRHQLLLADLRRCREMLESAGNNISIGFEARRTQFPRFYFLSDHELVLTLATQSPKENAKIGPGSDDGAASPQLWQYLRLCFPGIHRVYTKASSPQRELTSFLSAHDEQVPISSPIPTANVPLESWLAKLETAMGTILQACIRAAISDFTRKEFRKWCLLWPEQVLIATIYHIWTVQGELSNRRSSVGEARQAWREEARTLAERAESVGRELKAATSPSVRLTLSNVVLLLNQLQNVSVKVADELSGFEQSRQLLAHDDSASVESPPPVVETEPFETTVWLSQPRLYYDANAALGVKLLSFPALPFGFEYWGNASPPVYILPLTLRCYHAMALHAGMLNRGSQLIGPPGSGKKAACTALARLCARLMIHFDCQDYLHTSQGQRFHALVGFLKGAVASGAWLMMSGIHQLQTGDASTFASMCSQIMDCHASRLPQGIILGAKLKLKKGFHLITISSRGGVVFEPKSKAVFDRLRSSFRSIELQVHDLGVVSELYFRQLQMAHAPELAKLVNAVTQIIQRQVELLVEDAPAATRLGDTIVTARVLRDIIERAAHLCALERPTVYAAYGWPPQAPPSNLTNPLQHLSVEMPVDLVRDIGKMENKAVCIALREFASSFAPVQSLGAIDFILRDFAMNSLNRELRASKSFLITVRAARTHPGVGVVEATSSKPKQLSGPRSMEDAIVEVLREIGADGSREIDSSENFCSKVIQLYQALQHHRIVILLGGIQSGKSTLWSALARAMTMIYDDTSLLLRSGKKAGGLGKRARCVVIHPRAVTLDQLFGNLDSTAAESSPTSLIKLVGRDAKHQADQQSTWLVLDGDVHEVWAWQLLQTTECEAAPNVAASGPENPRNAPTSRLPGLLNSNGGKRLSLPPDVRVLMETTVLEHVSPSFITRVGVVNADGCFNDTSTKADSSKPARSDWRLIYQRWKAQHDSTFASLREELFILLDTLMDETMDACLDFVTGEFIQEQRFKLVAYGASRFILIRWRVQGFLALLHCFLVQSWSKIAVMVSGKQRKTAMHCYFLQALVWGIGHTSETIERIKFHTFLRQWIITGPRSADSSLKRVLVLFFPSGTMGSAATGLSGMGATQRRLDLTGGTTTSAVTKDTLYSFGFSVDLGSKWMRWPEFYDAWLAERCQLGSDAGANRSSVTPSAVPEESSVDGQTGVPKNRGGRSNLVFVRTPAMAAAVYLLHQLMSNGYPALLSGSRDSGKTTCGLVWLELHARLVVHELNNANSAARTDDDKDDIPVRSEHVYMSQSVTSRQVLEQLEAFIERKRFQQRRANHRRRSEVKQSRTHNRITSSTLVFVDDLHCGRTGESNNSVIELLRELLERRQLVHPSANTLMDCSYGLSLFAALQHDGSRPINRDLARLVARIVPIALPPLSDVELSSICSAFVTSRTASEQGHALGDQGSADFTYTTAAHEASQVLTSLVKASVRLFRVLSSDQWSGNGSQVAHTHAATIAFQPSKAHYLFHVKDILRVLQSVYCDAKQTMSLAEKTQIAKLWCHESTRVFGDRLIEESDLMLFYNLLQDTVVSHFNVAPDGLLASASQPDLPSVAGGPSNTKNQAQVIWLRDQLHFSFIGESSGAGMTDGYREVHELQKLELSIERTMMAMYRANIVTESLPFVLCNHAIRHILRLTRVLRHCDDRHLLLFGRSGCKMRTLTRLAAFVCHKNTTSFFASRGGSDSISWKATLKSALVECVRQPQDERLVFIVKDSWLTNPEIYGTLDRYLSGSKLLSDVISYDDFDDSVLQALRDESERERRGEETGALSRLPDQATFMGSKSSVIDYFFKIARRKLQFVIIISLPPDLPREPRQSCTLTSQRFAQLMWHCPFIQKGCSINYFFDWPDESLHVIAQKCLASSFATDRGRLLQLSQVAVQIYERTRLVWPVWARGDLVPESSRGRPRISGGDEQPEEPRAANAQLGLPLRDRPSVFIQVDPSMLVEQISLFVTHLPRLQAELETNKTKYASGLDFMERTEQILALEQSQQQLLQPEMARKTAATRRMSGNLEKEKLTATKVHHALEIETALVETQHGRLAQVEAEYNELICQTRDVFAQRTAEMKPFLAAMAQQSESSLVLDDESAESVDSSQPSDLDESRSLAVAGGHEGTPEGQAISVARKEREVSVKRQQRAMVRTFVSIPHPATSLRQLAECVGLIFGIEPVEARDELDPDEIVMDYWGTATRRMESLAFWQELAEFDVRARMTEKIVARVLPICTAPDFEPALFSGIHELGVLLCAWVQACANFARDTVLAEPKYAQLCQEKVAYEAAIAQKRAREVELNTQASSMSNASTMRTLSEQERKELEEKLKDNASTLQMTTSVWKVLQPCKAKWTQLYEHYTKFGVQAMGDLFLATAAMVYASSTTNTVRRRLQSLWSEELDKHYVMHSSADHPRPMHQLFLVDERTLTKWQIDGLPTQETACVDSAVTAAHSFVFPVLIDPHGIASNWLKHQCGELGIDDAEDGERKTAIVISAKTSARENMWEMITQCARKKSPLVIEDFNESAAVDLRSLLHSKRRARFDQVNRDLSSVGTSGSVGASIGGSSMSIRRTSSVSVGLGVTSKRVSGTNFGMFENSRCWFEIPRSSTRSGGDKVLFECGSESLRIYFVYSESESIPEWMAPLATSISIVRFEFSLAHTHQKCLRTILKAYDGHNHVLTEIEALQVDTISCDEQIEIIENEMLDFFSVEDPVVVYGDTNKALKIVGNRSALHTLENSKIEANKKIRYHYLRLASYSSLVKRTIDIVETWREVSALGATSSHVETAFPIERVWASLSHALEVQGNPARINECSTENHVGLFTTLLRKYVKGSSANDQVYTLFDLILSLKASARRRLMGQSLRDGASESNQNDDKQEVGAADEDTQELGNVLPRLVQLLECKDEVQLRALCAGVSSKLLAARPSDVIPVHKWRAMCYLAEKFPSLRELMTSQQLHGGKDRWKEVLDLESLLSESKESWCPKIRVDALSRLCLVAALHKGAFTAEMDAVIAHELAWTPPTKPIQLPSATETSDPGTDSDQSEVTDAELKQVESTIDAASRPLTQFQPLDLVELWKIYSSVSTPIVVEGHPEVDFVREVADGAAKVKATVDVTTQESTTDEAFEAAFLAAIRKGHWVVITHLDAHPSWYSIISRLLMTIHTHEPHSDFRLWISTLCSADRTMVSDLHAIQLVKRDQAIFIELFCRVLAVVSDQESASTPSRTSPSLCGTVLRVRLCVLHALVACRDHLVEAPWVSRGFYFCLDTFFDVLRALPYAELQCSSDVDLWRSTRTLLNEAYEAPLVTLNEQLVFACCADLVFERPSRTDSLPTDAAARTMPNIAQLLRVLDELEELPGQTSTGYIQKVWIHANRGFDARLNRASSHQNQFTICGLRRLLENSALLSAEPAKRSAVHPTPSRGGRIGTPPTLASGALLQSTMTTLMDSLCRFALDLEGYKLDETVVHEKFPLDYKRPLNQLFQHEVRLFRERQRSLISRIRYLQQVSTASQVTSPDACLQIEALRNDETPCAWSDLALHCPERCNKQLHAHAVLPFETFQFAIADRLRFFQSWLDTGSTSRFCVDKFQSSIQCLFEAIHQQFVRNLVGTAHCNGAQQCLRVVRIFEDKPQVVLPARGESVYIAGWQLHGHLQMEITGSYGSHVSHESVSSFERRKRSQSPPKTPQHVAGEVRSEGTAVILEISASCLSSAGSTSAASLVPGSSRSFVASGESASSNASSRRSSLVPSYDFWCPIFMPNSGNVQFVDEDASLKFSCRDHGLGLVIPSSLPVHQLVFSGSHLRLHSPADLLYKL